MKQTIVAERYAEALFEIAQESKKVDEFAEILEDLFDLLDNNEDLANHMFHPVIKAEDKKEVLTKLLKERVPAEILNFLYLVIDKKRIIILDEIIDEFINLRNALNETVVAEVVTAEEMYKTTKTELQAQLASYLGQQEVLMECEVDPDILGGVMVKVGDRLIDASLKTQLKDLAQTLMN